MKKMALIMLSCILMAGTAFADTSQSDTKADLYKQYTASLPDKTNTNEYLSFDSVAERAVKNSSSTKSNSSSLNLLEKQNDYYGNKYTWDSSTYANLLNLINSQASYKDARDSQKTIESSVKFTAKEVYAGIITDERNILVTQAALDLEEKELVIQRQKNKLGLVSDDTLTQLELAYEKSKENLKNMEDSLDLSYQSLNTLIGVSANTKYRFELSLTYEELEILGSIDTYAKSRAAQAASVKSKETDLKTAETIYNARGLNTDSTDTYDYESLKHSVNQADLALQDQKESVEESIKALYNTIKTQESSIKLGISELEKLKTDYETAQVKFESGLISELELAKTEQSVIEKEYSILKELYSHMLNVEKFNNPDLF